MALKVSTGLRNYLLDTGSLKASLAAGFIKIYSGTVPSSADDAIAGGNTLLCTISSNGTGTGINFDTSAASGIIAKASGETWKGTNAASGTATFYRHVSASDTGALSTTERRLQGAIATAGSDMNFSSVALTSGAEQKIDYYVVTLPTL
jgi:hypothetical protein